MKTNALVSVIIPCYNVSAFVEEAINSIIFQTYRNLEIWIIDDASTDDTLAKVLAFKDERIKVEAFKSNTRKIGAVNEVLKKVNGDFICFQDADDWSSKERIEKQVRFLEDHDDYGICFTNYSFNKQTNRKTIALSNEELQTEFLNFGKRRDAEMGPTICASMMIRGDILNQLPGYHSFFRGRVAEDIYWVYQILRIKKGFTVNQFLYHVQLNENSLTYQQFSGSNPKSIYSWKVVEKIIEYNQEHGVDLLCSERKEALAKLELQACEETLSEKVIELKKVINAYDLSTSYKVGRIILFPLRLIKSIVK